MPALASKAVRYSEGSTRNFNNRSYLIPFEAAMTLGRSRAREHLVGITVLLAPSELPPPSLKWIPGFALILKQIKFTTLCNRTVFSGFS
jgi:hypothetical protein